jgi:outer membrane protein assembly factor BamB
MGRLSINFLAVGTAAGGFMLALGAQMACGQVLNTNAVASDSPSPNDLNQPFLLPSVPSDVVESIDDYRRYCQRQYWEKAFKQLDKLSSAKSTGLVHDKDGVMIPPALLLARLILDLPEDGKNAFRLFYDADAKSLLEQAQGKDEEGKLAKVATQFLFTASGDLAADRWGDLLFERGDFSRAIGAWRSILRNRPDSGIPQPQLLVKVAVAAARDGHWPEFQEIKQQIHERQSEASVTVGGQSVRAIDYLEKLSASGPAQTTAVGAAQSAAKVRLSPDAKPLWQFRWFAQINPILGNREGLALYDQMYGRQFASNFVPPVAIDDARVYSDFVGYDIGINLQSGKLAWRSGRFYDLMKNDNGQNQINHGRNLLLEQSGIMCTKDRVWSVAHDTTNQNNGESRYYLIARDVATGKESFNSKTASGVRDWTMTGTPIADDSHIYLGAFKPNQPSDVYALCLNAADGKLMWNAKIGSYKNDPRQLYYNATVRSTVPSLLLSGGRLYFDTQAGSFVQINPAAGEIVWGLNYDSEMPTSDRDYGQAPEQCTVSAPMLAGGVLYFKGMRSRRLYAVDPNGPKILWRRPVSVGSVLVGVDRERIYMGGAEIMAYDLKTKQLLWSKPVPMGTGWIHPLLTDDRIYEFTPRGIYEIEKTTGEVVQIFRGIDMDSLGGSLLFTPRAIVAVSNLAITAYPLESTDGAAKEQSE